VQLLSDVSLSRIEAKARRRHTDEVEVRARTVLLNVADQRVAKGDVDAEGRAVDRAAEASFCAKALAFIHDAVALDVPCIRGDEERQVIAKVEAACELELLEHPTGIAHHAQVDVAGGARAVEA
jgi:hypothetical protein